jgi:hypothetical protein
MVGMVWSSGPPNARFSRRGATTGHERRGTPVAATNEVSAGVNSNRRDAARARSARRLCRRPAYGAASAASASYSARASPWWSFVVSVGSPGRLNTARCPVAPASAPKRGAGGSRPTIDSPPAVSDAAPRAYCATYSRTSLALAPSKHEQKRSRERACAKRRIGFGRTNGFGRSNDAAGRAQSAFVLSLGPNNARFSRRGASTGHERRGTPVAATNDGLAGANSNRHDAARARGPRRLCRRPAYGAASAASASYSATTWPW